MHSRSVFGQGVLSMAREKPPILRLRDLVPGEQPVDFFAVLAEIFRPKSFAGLFGAAPSIALATIGITIAGHGKTYAAIEARFM